VKVPVFNQDGKSPLMPTTKHRAMKMCAKREATPFWKRGVWCIRLNKKPSGVTTQPIVVGIDPGSKKEGFSVVSEAHTIANFQADAVQHVKDALEQRRNMRRARRFRNTPCRKNKYNRAKAPFPPSTKARWDLKLRIINWIASIYPVTDIVVEDIQAKTRKGAKKWNKSFSPLEVGKKWFYEELASRFALEIRQGWENSEFRKSLGLKKLKDKMSNDWHAHCVDAFALAKWFIGGDNEPTTKKVCLIQPFKFSRRQLHVFQPAKGGKRKEYGSTRSLGVKRGSIVKHPKYGEAFVGGCDKEKNRITLCCLKTAERLSRCIRTTDVQFKTYSPWRLNYA
jgi:hypothetical protein